jgi:hypothetical protein
MHELRRLLGCEPRLSALPVLTYLNVRCAPVLERRGSRHKILHILTTLQVAICERFGALDV